MNSKKSSLSTTTAIYSLLFIFWIGCSAVPVEDRYDKANQKSERANSKFFEDDTDLTPHYLTLDLPDSLKKGQIAAETSQLWFGYDKKSAKNDQNLRKTPGFRVQIFSTTHYEEADSVRADLYFKTNQKNIYLLFEPPNYKVRVGDYISQSGAQELAFKLSQLGVKNALVVSDSVLVRN